MNKYKNKYKNNKYKNVIYLYIIKFKDVMITS